LAPSLTPTPLSPFPFAHGPPALPPLTPALADPAGRYVARAYRTLLGGLAKGGGEEQ